MRAPFPPADPTRRHQDVYEDDACIHLVMELCEGGELLQRIQKATYSEKYIARLVRSMLRFISQVRGWGAGKGG